MQGLARSSKEQDSVIVGYLCAVTAATLAFLFHHAWRDIADGAVPAVPFPERLGQLVSVWAIFGSVFWIYAFFTAAWPFAATLTVARRCHIRGVLYYAVCGALTGIILTLVVLLPAWKHPADHDESFLQDWISMSPPFMIYGVCGALAFWYKAGRHIGQARRSGERAALAGPG